MKMKITFGEGVVVAFGLTVLTLISQFCFSTLFGLASALNLMVVVVVAAYLVYLLWRLPSKQGKVVMFVAWVVITLVLLFLGLSALSLLVVYLVMLCFIKAVFLYRRVLPSVLDACLTAVALLTALTVFAWTLSVVLSAWVLFLVLALFCYLPAAKQLQCLLKDTHGSDAVFNDAYRNASLAVKQLSARR